MRLLGRNKQTIYYRPYLSNGPITTTDEQGNELITGEYANYYGTLSSFDAYAKSAIGDNSAEPFGDFTSKKRTIYVEKLPEGFNEYAILWVGIAPAVVSGEPTVPHNFTVSGIAQGLNHYRIAVRHVDVSNDTNNNSSFNQ